MGVCVQRSSRFDHDSPSLRKVVIDGYETWRNNHFGGLSSLPLRPSSEGDALTLLIPLLAMLRDSLQLEEPFLWLGPAKDSLPSAHGIPTCAPCKSYTSVALPPP